MARFANRAGLLGSIFAIALICLGVATASSANPVGFRALPEPVDGVAAEPDSVETRYWMVRVEGRPSGLTAAAAVDRGASEAASGRAAVRQADRNEDNQESVAMAIDRRGLADYELFRVGTVFNGIAVIADPADAERIEAIDGVVSVEPLPLDERNNAHSVEALNAPAVWSPLGPGLTGAGMTIGVIDTGVDYVHTTFGGRGTEDDLGVARAPGSNPAATSDDPAGFTVESSGEQIYPSAKVVGGFDFAGDNYDARFSESSTPAPDPNPMDCPVTEGGGHGSHVAGTAAGYGTSADGTTYTGGYASHSPSGFRVGPGVAPEADIYALRVFGCDGSSALTTLAIDWAVDPNRDGDPSDRLDVINLSLGSPFGLQGSAAVRAVNAAAEAGTIVVASAGNSGNQIYQTGSPGSSPRAISVASAVSGVTLDQIMVSNSPIEVNNGPLKASYSVNFNWDAQRDTLSGALYYPSENPTGCDAFDAGEAAAMNGKVVLLDWRPDPLNLGSSSPCGSAQRVGNADEAGAAGVVIGDAAVTEFDTQIEGAASIPAAFVVGVSVSVLKLGGNVSIGTEFRFRERDARAVGTLNTFSSRGPAAQGGLKPEVSAPGSQIVSARAGSGSWSWRISGTSMAAPHVAGVMALLRQEHPDWSVEELKALLMNTTSLNPLTTLANGGGNIHPPHRAGAGSVDAEAATAGWTIAYASDSEGNGNGQVGVSLGALEVPPGQPFERDFFIKVVNKDPAVASPYTASFVERSSVPGVAWSFPDGNAFAVEAGESVVLRVRLRVEDPAALRNAKEATLLSGNNREWIAEASGLIRITDPGNATTTVPVYASLAPVSSIAASESEIRFTEESGSGSIQFEGTAVSTSGATTGPPPAGSNSDFNSMRTPLELQHSSPALEAAPSAPQGLAAADLKHVGVSYEESNQELTFGFSTYGNNPALSGFTVGEILIDSDRDGADDYRLRVSRIRSTQSGPFEDNFRTVVTRLSDNVNTHLGAPPYVTFFDFSGRAFDTDVNTMTVLPAWIGLSPANSRFDYRIRTFSPLSADQTGLTPTDETPTLTYDYLNEGVSFDGESIQDDRPGSLGFSWNTENMAANGSTGALILHHMNPTGERDEVIGMQLESPPELSVQVPSPVPEGSPVSLSASATDANDDPLEFSWDLEGGTDFSTPGQDASFTPDDGPSSRVVKARVSDGRLDPVTTERTVDVENVPPSVVASVTGSPPSGVRATASDPSSADTAAGFSWSFDVRSDGTIERELSGPATVTVPLRIPLGRSQVSVTATDKDGGVSSPFVIQTNVPTCRVPRLRGLRLAQARKLLTRAGCRLGKVKRPKSGNKARQVVRSQSIRPGKLRLKDTRVRVVLRSR